MTAKTLLPHHLDNLRASVTDETIAASGIYSAHPDQAKAILRAKEFVGLGMVIPYGDGFERVRLDQEDGEGHHYRTPKGERNRVYFPANLDKAVLGDQRTTLYLTEGEKKALALCQHGFPTIAIAGVHSWRTRFKGDSQVLPEFDGIAWKDRPVIVVFDSDIAWKPSVRDAEDRLAEELANRGAIVAAVRFPNTGAKIAADDFLKERGPEAFAALPLEPLRDKRLSSATEKEIDTMEFPTFEPLVKDLIPGGLAFLAAKAKVGKSILAYQLSRAVATGEPFLGFRTAQGEVCYLSLEEPYEDIQERRRHLGLAPLESIRFVHKAPQMKYGFAAALVDHLEKWPKTRLVVIDTMAWIRDEYEKNTDHRAQDHLFGKALLDVAHRFGVTILVNHHFTKGVSEDFLEDISGTTSLTAIANVILGLARARGASEGVLKVTGRKVADRDIRLEFRNLQWYRDDIGEEMDDATDEFEVAAYLVEKAAGEVRRLDDISSATGIPKPRLVKVLKRLEGTQVQRVTYGKYRGLLPEAA